MSKRKLTVPLWIYLIAFLAYITLLFFTVVKTESVEIAHIKAQAFETLKIRIAHMGSRIDNIFAIAQIIAADERIAALMKHQDYRTTQMGVNHLLIRIKVTTGLVVYIMRTDGSLLASGDWDNPVPYADILGALPNYLGTVRKGEYFQAVLPKIRSENRFSYSLSLPIRLDGTIEGIAAFKTNMEDLTFAEELARQILLCTDDNGTVILSNKQAYLGKSLHQLINIPPDAEPGHYQDIKIDRISYIPVSSEMDSTGWKMHIFLPKTDILSQVITNMILMTLVFAIVVLAAFFGLERWRHMKTIHDAAIRDPLTGLFTRLYMKEVVPQMFASHDRGNIANIGLILFDLDRFKRINDRFGHSAGDEVLKAVASVLLLESRKTDISIRYGGEELLLLIPSEEKQVIIKIAERICKKVSEIMIDYKNTKIKITISGGAVLRMPNESFEFLADRADKLLYQAKNDGRNQICFKE
ncbi:MAG: diguanylate cyclase [Proteobacteria bacterium]|nr:diguanylate cyclase [Pseudomonadota bacterium]